MVNHLHFLVRLVTKLLSEWIQVKLTVVPGPAAAPEPRQCPQGQRHQPQDQRHQPQGRYHNRHYATLAGELGLEVAHLDPIGWSATSVPEQTAARPPDGDLKSWSDGRVERG